MTCPHCQFELHDGAQFCSNCGRRIAPADLDAKTLIVSHAEGATLVRPTVADTIVSKSSVAFEQQSDPLIGVVLDGRYRLTGHLGRGGMGTVYRARRTALGDDVAVKILHRQFVAQPQMLDRFRREARAAAMLHHPNIVAIYDFGDLAANENNSANDEAIPAYIVMELLQGETLGALLKRELKLTPRRAVRILREVCAGVGAAHAHGIVHRDLKPDNIIVLGFKSDHPAIGDEDEDSRLSVKVVDFGIAKLRDMTGEGSDATLTHVGTMLGTPSYMSPEQCRGEHLDARADVYSLGAIAYELLTGRTPFTAPTANGVIAKHLTETPPPLRLETTFAPDYDSELVTRLNAVIRRALAKEPAARQADATGFARELIAAFRTPKAGVPTATSSPLPFTLANAPVPVQLSPAPVIQPNVVQAQTIETDDYNDESFDEPPKRTASRIGTLFGLLLVAVIAAGASALAWMLYVGGNSGDSAATTNRRANANTNQRPRTSPTPGVATPTPTVEMANTNLALPTPLPSATPANLAFDPNRVAGEVGKTLEGWTESTRDHDLDAHMDYYATQLEAFYRQPNADRSVVRARLRQAFDQYDDLDISISNLKVQLDQTGQSATAVFDKKWRFEGNSVSRGAVQQEIKLRKVDGRWLIISERDLRVYADDNAPPSP